ncbi:hypothetical protein [Candidatus Tisiphia endosymbiont of Beris chalybata]|uniref:hypothetical protein n=1 Tax=Candidatus Tisiphia endosymbiont of Beris chalybata TaxID=3066262 RepID=UPI00312C930C
MRKRVLNTLTALISLALLMTFQFITETLKKFDPNFDEAKLRLALSFNRQYSKSNKNTPLKIAKIITSIYPDSNAVITALLFFSAKENKLELINAQHYSVEIWELFKGINKFFEIYNKNYYPNQSQAFQFLLSINQDIGIRILLIRFGYLLDKIIYSTKITYMEYYFIALEISEIYVPLLKAIKIEDIQTSLQDVCFQILQPKLNNFINTTLETQCLNNPLLVSEVINKLHNILSGIDICYKVYGRIKSSYSIWKKVVYKSSEVNKIFDIIGIRIIVNKETECYKILRMIHNDYQVILNRFKNFITFPKSNGYQSLHTVIVDRELQKIEVQICTQKMYDITKLGLASHLQYKMQAITSKNLNITYNILNNLILARLTPFIIAITHNILSKANRNGFLSSYIVDTKQEISSLDLLTKTLDLLYNSTRESNWREGPALRAQRPLPCAADPRTGTPANSLVDVNYPRNLIQSLEFTRQMPPSLLADLAGHKHQEIMPTVKLSDKLTYAEPLVINGEDNKLGNTSRGGTPVLQDKFKASLCISKTDRVNIKQKTSIILGAGGIENINRNKDPCYLVTTTEPYTHYTPTTNIGEIQQQDSVLGRRRKRGVENLEKDKTIEAPDDQPVNHLAAIIEPHGANHNVNTAFERSRDQLSQFLSIYKQKRTDLKNLPAGSPGICRKSMDLHYNTMEQLERLCSSGLLDGLGTPSFLNGPNEMLLNDIPQEVIRLNLHYTILWNLKILRECSTVEQLTNAVKHVLAANALPPLEALDNFCQAFFDERVDMPSGSEQGAASTAVSYDETLEDILPDLKSFFDSAISNEASGEVVNREPEPDGSILAISLRVPVLKLGGDSAALQSTDEQDDEAIDRDVELEGRPVSDSASLRVPELEERPESGLGTSIDLPDNESDYIQNFRSFGASNESGGEIISREPGLDGSDLATLKVPELEERPESGLGTSIDLPANESDYIQNFRSFGASNESGGEVISSEPELDGSVLAVSFKVPELKLGSDSAALQSINEQDEEPENVQIDAAQYDEFIGIIPDLASSGRDSGMSTILDPEPRPVSSLEVSGVPRPEAASDSGYPSNYTSFDSKEELEDAENLRSPSSAQDTIGALGAINIPKEDA